MTDPPPLVEGRDYTVDDRGRYVFTAAYLLARGQCCGSGCQNCPYRPPERAQPIDAPAAQR
jgi:hypothetical protein